MLYKNHLEFTSPVSLKDFLPVKKQFLCICEKKKDRYIKIHIFRYEYFKGFQVGQRKSICMEMGDLVHPALAWSLECPKCHV